MNYNTAEFEASYGMASQLPPSGPPEIVFAGRSNVGKSTLLNKLFNRKSLARVSSQPGKTTTVNFYSVGGARFVDIPGYGYAKRSDAEKKRWAALMESYFRSGRNIPLVVLLLDMRRNLSPDDAQMIEFLKGTGCNFITVLTKCDKLNKTETVERRAALKEQLEAMAAPAGIEFSGVTGQGVDELKREIEKCKVVIIE